MELDLFCLECNKVSGSESRIPGCQEDLVSNWESACSLVEDACLGLSFPLASAHLPPCLWQGMGWSVLCRLSAASSLSFGINSVLCSVSDPAFSRESSLSPLFFFPSLWLSPGLGCYLTLSPSDCPQGIQAQSLP